MSKEHILFSRNSFLVIPGLWLSLSLAHTQCDPADIFV